MADIHPFRALRYNLQRVSASQVVTQPYDKITPAMQERYYAASPYNLVRIILGRREAEDNPLKSVYTRAAAYGRDWRDQGILQQDSAPSIYAYSQAFTAPSGARFERRGFIALGRVEDYAAQVVFRHEQTLAKPKADRLDLLRATRVHYEQLFLLYEDAGEIDSLLRSGSATYPAIDVGDEYGVAHRVWPISDPAVVASVQKAMSDKKLVIADGHHRYETALNFRNECRVAAASANALAPYEFVMMTFVNMNDPGLLVLPTHRVVHSLGSFSAEEFQKSSRVLFEVEEVDPGIDAPRATAVLQERGRAGTALLAVTANRAFVLHSPKTAGSKFLAGLSPRQQSLDVVQLHRCLLEGVLQLSEESIRNQQNLSYVREAAEALAAVRNRTGGKDSANIAFLMNGCPVQKVRDIAFAMEVMPQKSTDFYPKLLSGLTAYALD
ncbi:MAG TPA: DUF1015 domain-containing protein [Candidatus Dormibacteraeota bacterium]|nr:DUF1015 domain-containing protein [Candidatus Dormibacteraeota bacterium]